MALGLLTFIVTNERIFDPAIGELLTTVPFEIWERAWGMESYYQDGPIDNTFVIVVGTPVGG